MQLAESWPRILVRLVALYFVLIVQPAGAKTTALRPTTLSSPPVFVTGGDALLQLNTSSAVTVTANGRTFTPVPFEHGDRTVQRVLVDGLHEGKNVVIIETGGKRTRYSLVNHPLQGPLFSGEHQKPFVCETGDFKLPDGTSLGPANGPNCEAPTNIQFVYMSTIDGRLRPLPEGSGRPADIAKTTTSLGVVTDYVVRLETGVINRAIYQIAVLANLDEKRITFSRPPRPWNGRLIYTFGGGCGAAYHQGRGTGGVINNPEMGNDALAKGYAMASATLNVLGANCNDVTSAETMAMVREHFIEEFGPAQHVIGLGGSGGSMQQNLIAQNYPGLLDGLLLGRSYPDTLSVLVGASDCVLLQRYFKTTKLDWSENQKSAVSGYPTFGHCTKAWGNYMPRWISSAGAGCDATAFLTAQEAGNLANTSARQGFQLYDPARPDAGGVRCSYFDNAVNIWGRRPDGSTRWPLDNEGVQYGLAALRAGKITIEQFIDLNLHIGGFRNDGELQSARTKADPEALKTAYKSGRINTMTRLKDLPILDVRSYVDRVSAPDVHLSYTTEVARARQKRAYGDTRNFVSWTTPTLGSLREDLSLSESPLRKAMRLALGGLDEWLTARSLRIREAGLSSASAEIKPSAMVGGCWLGDDFVSIENADGRSRCSSEYPASEDPRLVAGEPIERMILKCALRPVGKSELATVGEQYRGQLESAFPEGVCDYGVNAHSFRNGEAWATFGDRHKRKN